MKRLFGAVVLLALSLVTTVVKAADCRVNGGAWQNIRNNLVLSVPVEVRLSTDVTRIILDGVRLECKFTWFPGSPEWHEDYWATGIPGGSPWNPGPKFTGYRSGLRILGAFHNTPIPHGVRVATMPSRENLGVWIDVAPFILIRNEPLNPIDVRAGDRLGSLELSQTNNYNPTGTRLFLVYTASNNFSISPSTCTINNNNPIEINFGDVNQLAIGTDPLSSSIRTNRTLTYACPDGGINTDITITYKGTPSSFNANLLRMSNPDVGTALVRGGAAVPVNGAYRTRINNSTGSDTVTFSLVKRAGSVPISGPISGTGVLVMGVP
ncbi:fimbrial protein [Pseudomonas sp. F8002]|uniref:fimbrial protein n=1 Tax=Pseudomonas sp. F8002 TaxID=2738822 RepID=UPI0015A346A8|nr:fimbrial protein [Pseudomonas sp. F8002]NWB51617.1 fimbrial protein [Pseudomonas sp. F8002]